MAENTTLPQIQAVRARIGLVGADGAPVPGANNIYTTSAFIKVGFAPVFTDGDEIEDKNAAGEVCAYTKADDTFKRGDVTIEVCTPDPYLCRLLEGGLAITAGLTGSRVGYAAPRLGTASSQRISLELWQKRILNGDLDADSPYAWWTYPMIRNLRRDPHEHGNGTLKQVFKGQAYESTAYGNGPANDWPAASDSVFQWIPCAADALPDADGAQTMPADD